jgi:hypothetical protein
MLESHVDYAGGKCMHAYGGKRLGRQTDVHTDPQTNVHIQRQRVQTGGLDTNTQTNTKTTNTYKYTQHSTYKYTQHSYSTYKQTNIEKPVVK